MKRRALLLAIGILLFASGCGLSLRTRSNGSTSAASASLGSQAACTPTFPDRDGWLGGDAAASVVVPRSGGRVSLWLFGDSFVSRDPATRERRYPFIHNSIALSRCDPDGRWRVEYAWGSRGAATPRAFFEPDPGAAWVKRALGHPGGDAYYWPISAASAGDAIYVALLRVVDAEPSGPLRLPFRMVGVDLARLTRTDEPLEAWQLEIATLSTREDVFPASSLVVTAGALHAFAFLDGDRGDLARILTRIPLARLASAWPSLESAVETWAEDDRWHPGLRPERARVLMRDAASEMSVHFDPGLGEWLAVYAVLPGHTATTGTEAGADADVDADAADSADVDTNADADGRIAAAAPPDALRLRRARSLTGPWSAPAPLLRIPELAARPDPLPGELFCYAGKAHPELAPSGELLVTWVCNVHAETEKEIPAVLERLRRTPSIYRPEAARIAVPPRSGPAKTPASAPPSTPLSTPLSMPPPAPATWLAP